MVTGNSAGYPIIEKAGYPAKYAAKENEIHLSTAYNILQSFDFMWPQLTFCDPMWPQQTNLMWP